MEHLLPRTLICVDCRQQVCTECAISYHKGHYVQEKPALMKSIQERIELLVSSFETL